MADDDWRARAARMGRTTARLREGHMPDVQIWSMRVVRPTRDPCITCNDPLDTSTEAVEVFSTSELLRVATAGSVDDGKSTLIGRLLYDAKLILEDQLDALRRTSFLRGDDGLNLALLTDAPDPPACRNGALYS